MAVNNISDIALVKQSILELTLQRPNSGTLHEVWGNISAHDATWNSQTNAGVHFAEGKITADAGDLWNPVPTPVIDVTFSAQQKLYRELQHTRTRAPVI